MYTTTKGTLEYIKFVHLRLSVYNLSLFLQRIYACGKITEKWVWILHVSYFFSNGLDRCGWYFLHHQLHQKITTCFMLPVNCMVLAWHDNHLPSSTKQIDKQWSSSVWPLLCLSSTWQASTKHMPGLYHAIDGQLQADCNLLTVVYLCPFWATCYMDPGI